MVGVSFAIEDGPAHYLPFGHSDGGNLDEAHVIQYLKDQAKVFKGVLVGANLQYDMDWLAQYGVTFWDNEWADVQVAEPLIDELQFSYSLNNIAERYGIPPKDEALLTQASEHYGYGVKGTKRNIGRFHSKFVGAYAERDAILPLLLLRRQERAIEEQDLWGIWNLEKAVTPVLVKMRRRGVRIDEVAIERTAAWTLKQAEEITAEITRTTGVKLTVDDITKKEGFADALTSIGVKLGKTATGQIKLTTAVLDKIDHPVAGLIRRAKQMWKVRNDFCGSLMRHAVDRRIHCTFNQTATSDDNTGTEKGARFGRMSCTSPNLQQQPSPKKDKVLGGMIRRAFLPEVGRSWACLDYSQQEPRFLVHFAESMGVSAWYPEHVLAAARIAGNRYRTDPNADNHQMMADIAGIARDPAKIILLGKMYGMGGGEMCTQLGLPIESKLRHGKVFTYAGPEGQRIMSTFDAKLPFVKYLQKLAEHVASRQGYVKTILGRRCRFPRDPKGGYDWTYKALNRIMQGSSADQTKKAMVDADREGFEIQLQVHDEVDLSISDVSEAMRLSDVMREAVPMTVPSKVDVEIGPNWADIKGWEETIS